MFVFFDLRFGTVTPWHRPDAYALEQEGTQVRRRSLIPRGSHRNRSSNDGDLLIWKMDENGGWLASCGITSHHLTVFCWFLLPRPPFWVGFILADLGRPALSAWFQSVKSRIFVRFPPDIGDAGDGSKPMIHLFWERGVEDTQLSRFICIH